ncbi:restriction endonuclease subunit S [Acetobacter senegalensis]|uniref:restriction endonuclease subunit S n=1 Tax=Acetobacter senegalensis TaxID=446692 RepID=UPI001EDBE4F9|nr:restriction endonuclease subunit S [Acetobacter senegalensis]MCG4256745.1 restriction endonuclease subunit S [Acetobacter senegalensis]MCG4266694.1 restriction endonuclease subunit S [Acetobacter senegalensis]
MSEARQTERLGDICYIKARIGWRGLSSSEYTEDGPYLIAGQHIRGGQITWDKCDHITEQRYLESHEIILRFGDVIITKDGTIGRVARIDDLPGDATINGTMMLVRPLRRLDFRYLYHILNGRDFQKLIDDKVSGSSIPHLFQRDMVELKVELPSRDHQSKIAEILDTLDTAIRGTEAVVAKLKAIKQGLLHDLLTRGIDANGDLRPLQSEAPHLYKQTPLGWLPKEWEACLLDNVAFRGSGHTPSKSIPSYWNGGIKWVSLSDSHRLDHVYIRETDKEISEAGLANSSAVRHPENTVILSRDAGIGKSAILASEMAVSQHFMAWRCGTKLNHVFLYYLLQREKPRFEAIAMGSTIKTIGLSFFKKYMIALPPKDEQDQIGKILLQAEDDIVIGEQEHQKLRATKSGLMDDLLTGRTSVTPLL